MIKGYAKEIFHLLGKDAVKLPILLFMFLGMSILDVIGLGLIAPYVAMILDPNLVNSDLYAVLTKFFAEPLDSEFIIYIASAILFLIFFIKSIVVIFINYYITKFSQDQEVRLRSTLMRIYQNLPYLIYLKRSGGEYVYNIYNLVGQFSNGVVLSGLRAVSDIIVAIMVFGFLAWSNIFAFILLVFMLSLSLYIYDNAFKNKLSRSGKITNTASSKLSQNVHEGIDGFKEIRILGVENFFRKKVVSTAKKIRDNQIIYHLILTLPRYILELVLVGFIVLFVVGSYFFDVNTVNLTSTLVLYGVASVRLMPIFNSFSSTINQLRFNRDTVSKLYYDLSYLKKYDYNSSKPLVKLINSLEQEGFQSIKLNNVTFSYPETDKKILDNVSIEIKKNKIIGIVGQSGTGKSTLMNIILGLLPLSNGDVKYNDKNIQECLSYFQSKIAYMPQDIYIIDDSIKNNIALGVPENEIDRDRLNDSINSAQLTDFVNNSPFGIETKLGTKGVKISGGQKQRIALGRVFYHQRDIIFMDESTSSLDNETEKEISDEIEKYKGEKTFVIISHRLPILKHCDLIYQLDHNGNIMITNFK